LHCKHIQIIKIEFKTFKLDEKITAVFSLLDIAEAKSKLANSINILSKKQLQYKESRHFVEFVYNYDHRK